MISVSGSPPHDNDKNILRNCGLLGGMDVYVRGFGKGSNHDQFYTDPTILANFLNYTTAIVSRYKNNHSIFSWYVFQAEYLATYLLTSSSQPLGRLPMTQGE